MQKGIEGMPHADGSKRKRLAVLGSTGSIGTQTLDIVRMHRDRFEVAVLSAQSNAELLAEQALEFGVECVVIGDEGEYSRLEEALPNVEVLSGTDGLEEAAGRPDTDVVVTAVVGAAGLAPTMAAIEAGARIALANKETMVVAGDLIRSRTSVSGAEIIPVDSEHSAIFQCLAGEASASVESLVLTASGGPFLDRDPATLNAVKPSEALAHPNWSMGSKITIDSATMMNKGLEVIEARWLFGIAEDRIQVVIHPQSIIHSMVTFVDGSTKAQLGPPTMLVPIQYALAYPERWPAPHERVDWTAPPDLTFRAPDSERFPCLELAYEALRMGGSAPAILNAANEVAVQQFLEERIGYTDIAALLEKVLNRADVDHSDSIESRVEADRTARRIAVELATSAGH